MRSPESSIRVHLRPIVGDILARINYLTKIFDSLLPSADRFAILIKVAFSRWVAEKSFGRKLRTGL